MPFEAIGEDRSDGKLESVYHRFPTLRGGRHRTGCPRRVPCRAAPAARGPQGPAHGRHPAEGARPAPKARWRRRRRRRRWRGALRIRTHVGRRTKGDLLRLMRHCGKAPALIRGGGHVLSSGASSMACSTTASGPGSLSWRPLPRELGEDQLRMFTELHTGATSSPLPADATPMERLGSRLPASPVGALFGAMHGSHDERRRHKKNHHQLCNVEMIPALPRGVEHCTRRGHLIVLHVPT